MDVTTLLEPVLRDEISRVNLDKQQRPKVFIANATRGQAVSLKAFCVRYAAYLRRHLEIHPEDNRSHSSGQRLPQVYNLIDQINAILGVKHGDGRTQEQYRQEIVAQVKQIDFVLDAYVARSEGEAFGDLPDPLRELGGAVKHCLSRCPPA